MGGLEKFRLLWTFAWKPLKGLTQFMAECCDAHISQKFHFTEMNDLKKNCYETKKEDGRLFKVDQIKSIVGVRGKFGVGLGRMTDVLCARIHAARAGKN